MKHFVTVAGVVYAVEIDKVSNDVYSASFQIGERDYFLQPFYSVENAITSVEQEVKDIYPELVACNAEPAPVWMREGMDAAIVLAIWNKGAARPAPRIYAQGERGRLQRDNPKPADIRH